MLAKPPSNLHIPASPMVKEVMDTGYDKNGIIEDK
jgi:hypothetical protein